MLFDYPAASEKARWRLSQTYGLTGPCQERLGAFIVYCGMFENFLERAIWAVKGEDPRDTFPSTDSKPVSALIGSYAKAAELRPDLAEVIGLTCDVSTDLMRYRNAIAHGFLMPGRDSAWFITNTRWQGEHRKKQSQDAHADENFLDLAVYSASSIARAVIAVFFSITKPSEHPVEAAIACLGDLRRARSMAHELRHHAALFNSEKY